MLKIAFIGANSQVGTETALYLKNKQNFNFELTCYVRTEYSSIIFQQAQIKWDTLDFRNNEEIHQKLKDFDVVVDFTYPSVQAANVLNTAKSNINLIMSAMKPNATFIYMSSIMAHGMPNTSFYIEYYKMPRTPYAYIKRILENYIMDVGRKKKISTYNLRLSQIHGVIQSVTAGWKQRCAFNISHEVFGMPTDKVNIAFINTVGEALIQCFEKKIKINSTYTIVEQPQWNIEQLYDFYNYFYERKLRVKYHKINIEVKKDIFNRTISIMKPYRSLLETFILYRFPHYANKIKGNYRCAIVATDIASLNRQQTIDRHLLGKVPTKTMEGVNISVEDVKNYMFDTRKRLKALIQESKN